MLGIVEIVFLSICFIFGIWNKYDEKNVSNYNKSLYLIALLTM